jgi:hypothetical protein
MKLPLVRDLAAEGFPVRLTCGVLGFSSQAYYSWLAKPVSDRELADAYLTNALVDAHGDDPAFGYRFLADELDRAGHVAGERRIWRLCSQQKLWSTTVRKGRRGKGHPGPAVHDDHVQRNFTAPAVNKVWVTDITEHPTGQGKVYCCAIKDLFGNRIVGYAIADRMTAELAVTALRRRSPDANPTVSWWSMPTGDRNFEPAPSERCWPQPACRARWAESPPQATTQPWSPFGPCCRRTF